MTAPDSSPPSGAPRSSRPFIEESFVDAPGVDAPAADDALSEAMTLPGGTVAPVRAAGPAPSMIRSSLVVSSLTLVSRVMGFVRDLAVSYTMGASASIAADAYNSALAFPNLFRRIFAEGAFAAAFVPAYSKSLARDGEAVADVLAADAMAVLAAATIAITLIAQLAMPWLMYLINPGYVHDPAKFKLAVLLTQISMPYLPCMAIYAHLSGVLNARGRFVFSALAPTLLNLGMLIAILPQHGARNAAIAASWGVVGSGAVQVGLLWWGVRRSGAHVDWRLPRLTPDIKSLIGKAVPGAFAASATQLNIFITGFLASGVAGGRSWLAVADRLYQLPLGLVGVAMGVALLPRLSQAVQAEDRVGAQTAMDQAIGFSLALTLPAASALIAMPYFLIDGLFTRGEFHAVDAHATAAALFHYGWGTPAFVLQQLFSRAFFARGDTKTPMRFALVAVAINIALGVVLFRAIGVQGIAAATATASWINVTMMASTLIRSGAYAPRPATLARIAKLLAASLVMAILLAVASACRPAIEAVLGRKEIAVVATAIWGAVIYVGMLLALQAVSGAEVRGALRRNARPTGGASARKLE